MVLPHDNRVAWVTAESSPEGVDWRARSALANATTTEKNKEREEGGPKPRALLGGLSNFGRKIEALHSSDSLEDWVT